MQRYCDGHFSTKAKLVLKSASTRFLTYMRMETGSERLHQVCCRRCSTHAFDMRQGSFLRCPVPNSSKHIGDFCKPLVSLVLSKDLTTSLLPHLTRVAHKVHTCKIVGRLDPFIYANKRWHGNWVRCARKKNLQRVYEVPYDP